LTVEQKGVLPVEACVGHAGSPVSVECLNSSALMVL
jgi:hypothetical protein